MENTISPILTVMDCLSDDYEFIGLIDLKKDTVTGFRFDGAFQNCKAFCNQALPGTEFDKILNTLISPDDFPAFLRSVDRDVLMVNISRGEKVTVHCRLNSNGFQHYTIEFAPNRTDSDYVAIAIRNVESVIRSRMEFENRLEEKVSEQTGMIKASLRKITEMQDDIIEAMATLVESRDISTGNHVQNTRKYVSLLIRKLQEFGTFPELEDRSYTNNIILSSVLHDVGKIFVSDMILNKPGKLTAEEFEIIRSHTTFGKAIVDDIFSDITDPELVSVISDIVSFHHEKWNGEGYPKGLRGEEIPLPARIMAVADVFDALVSKRSYKEALDPDEAIAVIEKDSGIHFDSRIVDALLSCRDEIKEYLATVNCSGNPISLPGTYSNFAAEVQDKAIVSAFVADYIAAGLCSPDTDQLRAVYYSGQSYDAKYSSISMIRDMFRNDIHPDDDETVSYALSAAGMKELLLTRSEYSYNYRYLISGEYRHRQLLLIRISKEENDSFDVLVGIRDIEEEVVLANTTERCMTALMNEERIEDAIGIILRSVTDFYGGDRAYIYTFDEAGQCAVLKQEYTLFPGIAKLHKTVPIPLSVLEDKIRYMEDNGIFVTFNTDKSFSESETAAFSARKPDALFVAPIIIHGKMTGFWGLDNPSKRVTQLTLLENMVYTVNEALVKANAMEQIKAENELIGVLVKDYGAIYRVNLVTRKVDIYGLDELAKKRYEPIFRNPNFDLDAFIDKYYIMPDVVTEDQDMLRKGIAVSNARRELKDKNEYSIIFRVRRDGVNSVYTEVKVFRAEMIDGEVTAVILAFKVVDDEMRREFERIQALHMISHDGLTGLLNRSAFIKKMNDWFTVSDSRGSALIFLDMDDFRSINDTYSHSEGDRIMISLASDLKRVFADGEIVSRFGGDEFSVFVPHAGRTEVYVKLMSFQNILIQDYSAKYSAFPINVSIGCAICSSSGKTFEELRNVAESELHQAKASGKNRMSMADV